VKGAGAYLGDYRIRKLKHARDLNGYNADHQHPISFIENYVIDTRISS
jgi:hypothetical protein